MSFLKCPKFWQWGRGKINKRSPTCKSLTTICLHSVGDKGVNALQVLFYEKLAPSTRKLTQEKKEVLNWEFFLCRFYKYI